MTDAIRANTQNTDPFSFEDPRFAGVDTTKRNDDLPELPDDGWTDPGFEAVRNSTSRRMLEDLGEIASETPEAQEILDAEVAAAIPAVVPPPAPAAPATPVVPVAEEPEIIEYQDGSSVTIEKNAKGWSATLDSNTGGGVEVFKGRTKDEMWRNLAAGKINSNRKIRDLNRQIKLGKEVETPVAPQQSKMRELTADELFEIKTQLNNNPDLALETWFQKKTGKTVGELVALAEKGSRANEQLTVEGEARKFREAYPEYYPTDSNLQDLCDYLEKNKLEWNVKNLGTAFEKLTEDGLLDLAPKTPVTRKSVPALATPPVQPTPVAVTPVPAPAPAVPAPVTPPVPDPRIVSQTRRVRGSFGIRQGETTSASTEPETPPTDEELDNLSNDDINQLFAGVRRLRAQSARR